MDAIDEQSFSSPESLVPTLAWRQCVDRTLEDMRVSLRHDRTITEPNLCRLFSRRWHEIAWSNDGPVCQSTLEAGCTIGRLIIQQSRKEICENHSDSGKIDPPMELKMADDPADGEGEGDRPQDNSPFRDAWSNRDSFLGR